VNKGPKKKKTY